MRVTFIFFPSYIFTYHTLQEVFDKKVLCVFIFERPIYLYIIYTEFNLLHRRKRCSLNEVSLFRSIVLCIFCFSLTIWLFYVSFVFRSRFNCFMYILCFVHDLTVFMYLLCLVDDSTVLCIFSCFVHDSTVLWSFVVEVSKIWCSMPPRTTSRTTCWALWNNTVNQTKSRTYDVGYFSP